MFHNFSRLSMKGLMFTSTMQQICNAGKQWNKGKCYKIGLLSDWKYSKAISLNTEQVSVWMT